MKRSRFAVLVLALAASPWLLSAHAQQNEPKPMDPELHPKFEVATIKLSDPDKHNSGFHTEGTRLFYENETMQEMLAFAYKVTARQVVGAPDWFTTKHFDIRGTADEQGIPSLAQQQEMLRVLLEDRFKLKVRHEERDMARVVITVARGGQKMNPTERKDFLPDVSCRGSASARDCTFAGISMDLFAYAMQFLLDRPVINKTGLDGKYDFHLKFTPTDAPASTETSASADAPPNLFTAMTKQAGLHAESSRGPTEVIVVEHIELPSEN